MENGPIKVGLIGLGRHMMRSLLPNIFANQNFHVVSIADTNPALIKDFQNRFPGITAFSSARELILQARELGVQAVIVAVDPKGHEIITREAVDAGLHVFVEKPACEHIENLSAAHAIAESKGLTVMVGTMWRYTSVTQMLRKWSQSKELAQMFVVATFPGVLKREGWNVDLMELALYDMFIHPIDYALFLGGRPCGVRVTPYESDDTDVLAANIAFDGNPLINLNMISGSSSYHIDISLGFKDGSFASIKDMSSFSVNTPETWTGTTGSFRDRPIMAWEHGNLYRGYARHGYAEEMEAFYSSITTGSGNFSDLSQAINTMDVLEACKKSLQEGEEVTLL